EEITQGGQTRGYLTPSEEVRYHSWSQYEVGESSSAAAARPVGGFRADYSFVATGDREIMLDGDRGEDVQRSLGASDRYEWPCLWRQTVILELLRIDHRRSTEISELRTALQGQVTALQGHVTALQA
nr:hypothetical protein [Tanacetum cinerariifolium]